MPERTCQRPGCGRPIPSRKRQDARWCSRACESKARRAAGRKAGFIAANPGAGELLHAEAQTLVSLHGNARAPRPWADIEAGRADPDEDDATVRERDHQGYDEDAGIHAGGQLAPDPRRRRNEAFAGQLALMDAIERVHTDFDRRARPFIEQQRRNPGVVRPELAALLRERDSKIGEMTRAQQLAQALERAARDQPQRAATAHERHLEEAASRAFAMDLGTGCPCPQTRSRPGATCTPHGSVSRALRDVPGPCRCSIIEESVRKRLEGGHRWE